LAGKVAVVRAPLAGARVAPPDADQDILRKFPDAGDAPNPAERPVTDDGPWRITPAAVDAAVVEATAAVGDGFGWASVG
jgi:hypothetical protein